MAIVCRTLVDLRSPVAKFISQTFLMASSWHRHASGEAPLQVGMIGPEEPALTRFLDEVGAVVEPMSPGPNDSFSKSSNKIQASHPAGCGRRVLLLDNDVCFLGGIAELESLPAGTIAASEPGNMRVTDAQWRLMQDVLGIALLRRHYSAVNARPPIHDHDVADEEAFLYVNSGVLLFPAGHDPRASWYSHQSRIRALFEGHALASNAVIGRDQD